MNNDADAEYQLGCQKRDGMGYAKNAEEAIVHFMTSGSYSSLFAIGEMYQYGIPDGFKKDPEKAAEAFLDVRNAFNEDFFEITTDYDVPFYEHSEITLENINQLLSWAKSGDPEALYQLAYFYQAELDVLNSPNPIESSRKIEATKEELVRWMEACYLAATKLYHPKAAYEIVDRALNKNCQTKISPADLVKYSRIAVDPHNERFTPQAMSSQVYLRGTAPVICTLNLTSGLPSDLYIQQPINQKNNISGLYANSVQIQSKKSILPLLHKPFNSSKDSKNTLDSHNTTSLTPEQIREQRLKFFSAQRPPVLSDKSNDQASILNQNKKL